MPPSPKPSGTSLISLDAVSLAFQRREILSSVSLDLQQGEVVTLIGPNGAGKTSLIRLALGIMKPDSGNVRRRPGLKVGYVPQTVAVDDILPLTVRRFVTLGVRARRERVREVLALLGVERLYNSPIQGVSGGEFRRVLLARALLRDIDLLVLDEPTQGVDVMGQAELYSLLGDIRAERGCGILLVSHDLHLVMAATDRVVCLDHHICCQGAPGAVSRDPAFQRLFGERLADELAVYVHDFSHDHTHSEADPAHRGDGV